MGTVFSASAASPESEAAFTSSQCLERQITLGRMTEGIVHDLRNVLSVVDSALRLIERNLEPGEATLHHLLGAREGVSRGEALMVRLLDFAKYSRTPARPDDVNMLIRRLAPLLRYAAGPAIRVEFCCAHDLPKCLIEPSLFDAALLNIVANARDAMQRGGTVRVSTDCVEDARSPSAGIVRVIIEDEGDGISPEVMRDIFAPFFTTKGERGTGLGLPQVRWFVQVVGGEISIDSTLGVGTKVVLTFPVRDDGKN